MSLFPKEDDILKSLKIFSNSNNVCNEWLSCEIEKNRKLEAENNHYCEWMKEALMLIRFIEDEFELKYEIKLPDEFYRKVKDVSANFKFGYLDDK